MGLVALGVVQASTDLRGLEWCANAPTSLSDARALA